MVVFRGISKESDLLFDHLPDHQMCTRPSAVMKFTGQTSLLLNFTYEPRFEDFLMIRKRAAFGSVETSGSLQYRVCLGRGSEADVIFGNVFFARRSIKLTYDACTKNVYIENLMPDLSIVLRSADGRSRFDTLVYRHCHIAGSGLRIFPKERSIPPSKLQLHRKPTLR